MFSTLVSTLVLVIAQNPCDIRAGSEGIARITPSNTHIVVGQTIAIRATPIDSNGNELPDPSTAKQWSVCSGDDVARVDQDGRLRGLGVGNAKVAVMLTDADDSTVYRGATVVTVGPRPLFNLDASIGAALELNGDSGKSVSQLAGLTGEVDLAQFDLARTLQRVGRWLRRKDDTSGRITPGDGFRIFSGPVRISGGLFLALAPAAIGDSTVIIDSSMTDPMTGMPPPDTTIQRDSTLLFDDGSYGFLRVSVPLIQFKRGLLLSWVYEDGFVALRGQPNQWHQRYYGAHLEMGNPESFLEVVRGRSENLRPAKKNRWRITVQLQVPDMPITFRVVASRADGAARLDPTIGDNPIGMAVFSKIPLATFFRSLGLLP